MHRKLAQDIGFNRAYYMCLKILQEHYNAPLDTYYHTTAYLKHLRIAPNIIDPPQATVPTKIFQ